MSQYYLQRKLEMSSGSIQCMIGEIILKEIDN
jgi:hypothetical protein